MPSVELHHYSKPSMWQKMAVVNWGNPRDPQVHVQLEVDMSKALD